MLHTWLRQLRKHLLGDKTDGRASRRQPRSVRLSVEGLEAREVMSAPVPGFALIGGNLYNTAISQQHPIDTGVQNFTVVNNKVFDVHTNGGTLESMNSDGSGKVTLDSNVKTSLVGPGGNAFTLDGSGNVEVNGVSSTSAQAIYQSTDPSGNPVVYAYQNGVLWQYNAGSWANQGGTSEVVQACGQLLCTSGSGANMSVWVPTGLIGGTQSFAFVSINDGGTNPIQGLYQGHDPQGNPVAYLNKDNILWQFTGASHFQYVGAYQRTTDDCWANIGGTPQVVQDTGGQLLCTSGSGANMAVWTPTGVPRAGVASWEFVALQVQGLYQGRDSLGGLPVGYILQNGDLREYNGVQSFADYRLEGLNYHLTTDNCWTTLATNVQCVAIAGDGTLFALVSDQPGKGILEQLAADGRLHPVGFDTDVFSYLDAAPDGTVYAEDRTGCGPNQPGILDRYVPGQPWSPVPHNTIGKQEIVTDFGASPPIWLQIWEL